VAKVPPWFFAYIHTSGAESSHSGDNDSWSIRLLDRIAAERAAAPLMPTRPVRPPARHAPTSAYDDAVGWIARGYVWGETYAQLLTHVVMVLVAPVALFALNGWLLAAVITASAAQPNAGYHTQFSRPSPAMPVLPMPVRSRAARLAGLALSPLPVVGLWLLGPLSMFSWRFAFWVPQTIYRLWLQMNS
jgi:hypothetical protein